MECEKKKWIDLKDKKNMIYKCDKCGLEAKASDNILFCFIEHSKYDGYAANRHLCEICFMKYYEQKDKFIDLFFNKESNVTS